MALTIIFGVNGVGKDTLARQLQKANPSIAIISGSRILMKALDMDVEITADFPVPFEYYQRLDALDLKTANGLYETKFPAIIRTFKNTGRDAVMLYHLCIVKVNPLTGEKIFDDDFVRESFYDLFDQFVLIQAEAPTIHTRCRQDQSSGQRTRNTLTIDQIKTQIEKSNHQWQKLCDQLKARNQNNFHELDNNSTNKEAITKALQKIITKTD